MIITIDGPAGTGKSTIAKRIAKELQFLYFDTGAMYRSFAWLVLKNKVDPAKPEEVKKLLHHFSFEIRTDEKNERRYFVQGHEVTHEIRTLEISSAASLISVYPTVREKIVQIQRKYAKKKNCVFEGRDMGTVVFPKAELKIYLTASTEIRAERRYLELAAKASHGKVDKAEILKEIGERDDRDTKREISPLKKAPDAFLIDTSFLTADEVAAEVKKLYYQKISRKRRPFFYALTVFVCWLVLKLFFRLKIYGRKHIPKGPAIVASNHASNLDPPVISAGIHEEMHFLAKESLFKVPILGKMIRNLNAHPVGKQAGDAKIFKLILEVLDKGDKILLFPEGARTLNAEIQPFQPGLGFLTWKAKCTILPAYIKGTFKALPPNQKFPKLFVPVSITIGSPILFLEFAHLEKREAMEKIAEKTFEAIIKLKQWVDNGAVGDPP